jgi:nucleoside 2-deoxyribosyltransferase
MNIYVASSFRNERQPTVVHALRELRHAVYDFKDPSNTFDWRAHFTREQLTDPRMFRNEVLTHPVARAGFKADMSALEGADATVLVLPCGRSAHLELGYAIGAGQTTVILLDDPMSEPELMYSGATYLCTSIEEVLRALPADWS